MGRGRPRKASAKTFYITVRLTPAFYSALSIAAHKRGIPVRNLVRQVLWGFLKEFSSTKNELSSTEIPAAFYGAIRIAAQQKGLLFKSNPSGVVGFLGGISADEKRIIGRQKF